MFNLIYDFVPVLLFFFAFKFYGIYAATVVGIISTAAQVLLTGIFKKKIDKQQLITLIVFVIFGGMTLYFHNPMFVKWKPSVIFWIFGTAFIGSQFIGKKPLIQRMLEKMLETEKPLPNRAWKFLNAAWAIFFLSMGTVNIYIAYHYSTDTWVNFKFYGILGLLLAFSFAQGIYLSRYLTETK